MGGSISEAESLAGEHKSWSLSQRPASQWQRRMGHGVFGVLSWLGSIHRLVDELEFGEQCMPSWGAMSGSGQQAKNSNSYCGTLEAELFLPLGNCFAHQPFHPIG